MNSFSNATHTLGYFSVTFLNGGMADDIESANLYVTAEKNSYGAVSERWFDGEVVPFQLEKGILHPIKITEVKRYKYVGRRMERCTEKSFYECWAPKLSLCSQCYENDKICAPYSLPSEEKFEDIPICHSNITLQCYAQWFPYIEQCFGQRPCSVQEYVVHEELSFREIAKKFVNETVTGSSAQLLQENMNNMFFFMLIFDNLAWAKGEWTREIQVDVFTEYFVWSGFSLCGNIGGQLGLWVGFSCTGCITWISSKIHYLFNSRSRKKEKNRRGLKSR